MGCTIASVNQPLNDAATIPVSVRFDGDNYYLPSDGAAVAKLQYLTGRAYGLAGTVNLPLLSVNLAPTPDTGPVRTASASDVAPCTATVQTPVGGSHAVCARMTTSLNPGTATATAHADDVNLGILGLPVIAVTGLSSSSTSACTGASGATTIGTLTIGGKTIAVPTAPNSTIDLAGGAKLVINEQLPVAGADHGLTVNAVHLIGLGGVIDIVIGSSSSAAHNC